MLFSSMTFLLIFLPVTLILYYLVPMSMKNMIMLIASLIFYAWGEPVYVILLILSILFNYASGLDIQSKRNEPELARGSLFFSIGVNIVILCFFKYYGLLLETLNTIFSVDIPYRVLSLPIGLSFYTFQAISYLVDVYRQEAKAQRNLISFAMYIAMFPQLIAGPIIRYVDIEKQLKRRVITLDRFGEGAMLFIRGLAKKAILANSIGALSSSIQAMSVGTYSALTAWAGCIAFAFQIYFDFSGYSDMAIGLGLMFGFTFKKNFDYPYISKSITEFWRRWHISLSTWFREYVYFPLGGNMISRDVHIRNLLIVWALTGLWHGASWTFLLWGVYYGGVLIFEKYILGDRLLRWPAFFRHLYTMVVILIGWVFFFSNGLGDAFKYIGSMFGIGAKGIIDSQGLFCFSSNWLVFVLCILGSTRKGFELLRICTAQIGNLTLRRIMYFVVYIGMLLISIAFLVTDTFNPFLYFRF